MQESSKITLQLEGYMCSGGKQTYMKISVKLAKQVLIIYQVKGKIK